MKAYKNAALCAAIALASFAVGRVLGESCAPTTLVWGLMASCETVRVTRVMLRRYRRARRRKQIEKIYAWANEF